MPWQLFGTLAGGNQPASLFDTLSGQIANTVIIPCACGGSANSISLTPLGGTATPPTISAYVNFLSFAFVAASNSTGLVQLQAFSLAVLPLYSAGGTSQAGSGAINAGQLYVVMYQSSLNSGNGGFVIVSASASTLAVPVTVSQGGTGLTSTTAFAVMCGGTNSTNPLQPIASVGNAGQGLISNGAGALPTFQNIVAGGFTLLATLTASNSATLQDTTHITSTYAVYAFTIENLIPVTNAVILRMRVSEDSGGTWKSTGYASRMFGTVTDGNLAAAGSGGSESDTAGFLLSGVGTASVTNTVANTALRGLCGTFYFTNPNSSNDKCLWGQSHYDNMFGCSVCSGFYTADAGVVNGVQFLFSSGNLSAGKIRIYGVSA